MSSNSTQGSAAARPVLLGVKGETGSSGGLRLDSLQKFGSPAKAGLKVGDEVIATNGETATSVEQWGRLLAKIGVGNTATLRVLRGGKPIEVAMKLLEQKSLAVEVKALEQMLERKISP
jgi:S1-C subfamily serine protease